MTSPHTEIAAQLAVGLPKIPGIPEPAELSQQLTRFLVELERWNKAYNLTAVRDPVEMVSRHVFDSLSVLPFVNGARILDVGTGAGFPGIPLALCRPDSHFVLLDSNGKKIRFLQHAVAELGLLNVAPVQARAEAYVPTAPFDAIVCRAYTSLAEFVHSSGRLVAAGGRLVAMKGKRPEDEIDVLPEDWRVAEVQPVTVPGLDAQRHIVVLVSDSRH